MRVRAGMRSVCAMETKYAQHQEYANNRGILSFPQSFRPSYEVPLLEACPFAPSLASKSPMTAVMTARKPAASSSTVAPAITMLHPT